MNNSLQIKRIMNEITEFKKNPSEMLVAGPLENDLRTWHFTIRGPKDSEFEEGLYHGKIELSSEYPIKPPNLYFLTPNGRFEVNTKICLNITKFHKESWNPSWTIRTMLEALINYFPVREQGFAGVGALDYSIEERKKLAILSQKFKCEKCGNLKEILPVFKAKYEKNDDKKDDKIDDKNVDKKEEKEEKIDNKNEENKENKEEKEENKEEKEEKEEKLIKEFMNLRENIKEFEEKSRIQKKITKDFEEKREENQKSEEKNGRITFDFVLTDVNLLQEVIKSIKFNKNPLNTEKKIFEEEKARKTEEIPMNFQMKSEKTNENREFSDKNQENTEIKKNILENIESKEENEIKQKKPEVIHAENTLRFFERLLRLVQMLVILAVVAYIYLL